MTLLTLWCLICVIILLIIRTFDAGQSALLSPFLSLCLIIFGSFFSVFIALTSIFYYPYFEVALYLVLCRTHQSNFNSEGFWKIDGEWKVVDSGRELPFLLAERDKIRHKVILCCVLLICVQNLNLLYMFL